MKTVPSLIASSTVGIAAAGLALGRPEHSASVRPTSKKRRVGDLANVGTRGRALSSPMSRTGTSSTMITSDTKPLHTTIDSSPAPQPTTPQTRLSTARADTSHSGQGRRLSTVRNGDALSPHDHIGEDTRRESVSSRGSWIRRLSIIPTPQTSSPRSSVGPDSPSLVFSHDSAAPILSNPSTSPAQLPPNKLVKRTSSTRAASGYTSRVGSKSQAPTLRRPATSHQRSVTLLQQFRGQSVDRDDEEPSALFVPADTPTSSSANRPIGSKSSWRPFFDSRPAKIAKERSSGMSNDGSIQSFYYSTSRRVLPDNSVRPVLLKPGVISSSNPGYTAFYDEDIMPSDDGEELENDTDLLQDTSTPSAKTSEQPKRARRSLSMHFSSPSSWISKSGSMRGNKRNVDGKMGGKRYSSAPVSTTPGRNTASAYGPTYSGHRAITDPALFRPDIESTLNGEQFGTSFQARSRNNSSPLPPLSRLSSFNLDLARLGLSSSSSSVRVRSPNHAAKHGSKISTSMVSSPMIVSPSPPYFGASMKPRPGSEVVDRASTLVGSDTDGRAFAFGDDDDIDFQSETVFDSLRSGATGSIRSHGTPLDSMFDESPPSIAGSKTNRLSIHEILGNGTLQDGIRIVEEDEGMSTPIKGERSSQELNLQTPVRSHVSNTDIDISSSPPSFSLATKDLRGVSLDDDDDDEDWTQDDEDLEHCSQLSPPSSSVNSRRVSPSFRAALADLTHSGSVNGSTVAPQERPKSNLFDWSEPLSSEKMDYMGNSPRPKTAHVKQMADGRGGRMVGRRGPSALHIRSQSVPVVPDVVGQREHSKLAPKFGTWGLGGKGVSEEWDGDFDFDNSGDDEVDEGNVRMEYSGMHVPPSIQASQENVVGHVGQIREVCLLVEDLKRLRTLGREKDLLDGPSARLWKEAEGIIALAVPDEDDITLSSPHSPPLVVQHDTTDDNYVDHGHDVEDISRPEMPFEVLDRHGRPTGYVYDGNTVCRRSVFSPEDDIFGAGTLVNSPSARDHLRPPANNSPRHSSMKTSAEYARTVMETMHQHRSTSDPLLHEMTQQAADKMPFDTTSLRDLVHRASVLSRTLSDLIRKAEGSPSPEAFPQPDSSPAFTRVFTDPTASPSNHLPRSQSNNSVLGGSMDTSPTRSLGQRMHMMTVV